MLFLLNMEYGGALGRIRASVVRGDDELSCNVTRYTKLISNRLENIDGELHVEDEFVTANAGFSGTAETLGEVIIDGDGPTIENIY